MATCSRPWGWSRAFALCNCCFRRIRMEWWWVKSRSGWTSPIPPLSRHLEKLRNEGLAQVRRESTFLRYTANTEVLQELLQFLYAECCTRNKALKPQAIVLIVG